MAEAVKMKRKKRGPKPKIEDGMRDTAYLPAAVHEFLVKIGDGTFSHGVRIAQMVYDEQYGDEVVPDLLLKVK
ncbi:hypothetical protein KC887_07955 [Candidatus Kaiserbacteria bacterium]|nr:hypothetical protein [Candidatus Kaiserbacteria bacterium]